MSNLPQIPEPHVQEPSFEPGVCVMLGPVAWLLVPLSYCTHPDSTWWFLDRKMPQQKYIFPGQEDCSQERAGSSKNPQEKEKKSALNICSVQRTAMLDLHIPVKTEPSGSPTSSSSLQSIPWKVLGQWVTPLASLC